MNALETEKAQLATHEATMTQELAQKSEEIQCYKAEQTVVLNRVWDLIGNPNNIVNKAHVYYKVMETAGPSTTRETLHILV